MISPEFRIDKVSLVIVLRVDGKAGHSVHAQGSASDAATLHAWALLAPPLRPHASTSCWTGFYALLATSRPRHLSPVMFLDPLA